MLFVLQYCKQISNKIKDNKRIHRSTINYKYMLKKTINICKLFLFCLILFNNQLDHYQPKKVILTCKYLWCNLV